MASLSVCELIFQAVNNGSSDLLNEILYKYGPLSMMKNMGNCNEEGETPLLLAIRLKHFDVIDSLLDLLKKSISDKGCPQCLFSIIRQISEKLPPTEWIGYLVSPTADKSYWLDIVLNSIMSSSIIRSEKIVALELMGAAFIFNHTKSEKIAQLRGLQCWKEAMVLRYSPTCGEPTIPVIPLLGTGLHWKAFGHVDQLLTLEQLENLKEHSLLNVSQKNWHLLCGSLRVQALLVCQRIFKQLDPEVAGPNLLHLKNLYDYLVSDCWDRRRYCRSINTSLIILEESKRFNSTSSPTCVHIFFSTLNKMASCFSMMEKEPLNSFGRQELSSTNLLEAVKFGTNVASAIKQASLKVTSDSDCWYRCQLEVEKKMYEFVSWLFKLFPELNLQEKQQLKDHLSRYVQLNVEDDSKSSLLHLAVEMFIMCDDDHDFVRKIEIIEYLLHVGGDPNDININGQTPLHLLAEQWLNWKAFRDYESISEFYFAVFELLVDAGAHLDQSSSDGQTVLSILKKQQLQLMPYYYPELESITNTILPLSCYCAQAIRKHEISYGELPPTLQSFVLRHH